MCFSSIMSQFFSFFEFFLLKLIFYISYLSYTQFTDVRMNDLQKKQTIEKLKRHLAKEKIDKVVVVCRRGNNSQKAVECFKQNLHDFDYDSSLSSINGNNNNSDNNNNSSNEDDNNKASNTVPGIGNKTLRIFDIVGGLYEWKKQVDDNMPIY